MLVNSEYLGQKKIRDKANSRASNGYICEIKFQSTTVFSVRLCSNQQGVFLCDKVPINNGYICSLKFQSTTGYSVEKKIMLSRRNKKSQATLPGRANLVSGDI